MRARWRGIVPREFRRTAIRLGSPPLFGPNLMPHITTFRFRLVLAIWMLGIGGGCRLIQPAPLLPAPPELPRELAKIILPRSRSSLPTSSRSTRFASCQSRLTESIRSTRCRSLCKTLFPTPQSRGIHRRIGRNDQPRRTLRFATCRGAGTRAGADETTPPLQGTPERPGGPSFSAQLAAKQQSAGRIWSAPTARSCWERTAPCRWSA